MPKRDPADGVRVLASDAQILGGNGVEPAQPPPFAHADLVPGGHDADVFPHAAQRAQAVDELCSSARARSVAWVTSLALVPLPSYS